LECSICPAGWTGRIGSWCAYCLGRNQRAEFETAELVLRPGLPERGDQQYAGALKAWAERLARAVESGLIEESAAIAAYERER
jgi:hypothetical protein